MPVLVSRVHRREDWLPVQKRAANKYSYSLTGSAYCFDIRGLDLISGEGTRHSDPAACEGLSLLLIIEGVHGLTAFIVQHILGTYFRALHLNHSRAQLLRDHGFEVITSESSDHAREQTSSLRRSMYLFLARL